MNNQKSNLTPTYDDGNKTPTSAHNVQIEQYQSNGGQPGPAQYGNYQAHPDMHYYGNGGQNYDHYNTPMWSPQIQRQMNDRQMTDTIAGRNNNTRGRAARGRGRGGRSQYPGRNNYGRGYDPSTVNPYQHQPPLPPAASKKEVETTFAKYNMSPATVKGIQTVMKKGRGKTANGDTPKIMLLRANPDIKGREMTKALMYAATTCMPGDEREENKKEK